MTLMLIDNYVKVLINKQTIHTIY